MSSASSHQARYSIGVASRRSGLSEHTIRVWEHRYSAVTPSRSDGQHRRYTDAEIQRLQLLRAAQRTGRSIGELAALSNQEIRNLLRPAESSVPSRVDDWIGWAHAAVQRNDPWILIDTLSRATVAFGHAVVADTIIAPLLATLEQRLNTDQDSTAQVQLAVTTIRLYLGSALAAHRPHPSAPAAVAAVLRPRCDFRVLAAAVAAAVDGWRVAYLGAETPVSGIITVAHSLRARIMLIGADGMHDAAQLQTLTASAAATQTRPVVVCEGFASAELRRQFEDSGVLIAADTASAREQIRDLLTLDAEDQSTD